MEPVEINAGRYYLRALRADDRMDDRPAVLAGVEGVTTVDSATAYVERRAAGWAGGTRCSWAVADQVTGEMLAEVGLAGDLDGGVADAYFWAVPERRGKGVVTEALGAVLRFGFGALDLREVTFRAGVDNHAAVRVAEKVGFGRVTREGREVTAVLRAGEHATSR